MIIFELIILLFLVIIPVTLSFSVVIFITSSFFIILIPISFISFSNDEIIFPVPPNA